MSENIFRNVDDMPVKEMVPGHFSRLLHTGANTINILDVKADSVSPMHQHPHHQCAFVLEGAFEMTVGDETHILTPGLFAVIPPNTIHGGRAITDCKLLDVFSPEREDFK